MNFEFTLTVPSTRNFRAIDLINEYAKNTRGLCVVRDQYFTPYVLKNGVWYKYDHWRIEQHPENPDLINVTIFMTEK